MYSTVSTDGTELIEPEDVTSFSVVCPPDLDGAALADLGEVLPDGEHVMIPVATVRRMARGRVGEQWETDLAGCSPTRRARAGPTPTGRRLGLSILTETTTTSAPAREPDR